jgi:hypothetical protein
MPGSAFAARPAARDESADAEADLLRGFRFYERKSRGVGWYFLDSLYAEIESLRRGFIGSISDSFVCYRGRFPYAIYYRFVSGGVSSVASRGSVFIPFRVFPVFLGPPPSPMKNRKCSMRNAQ